MADQKADKLSNVKTIIKTEQKSTVVRTGSSLSGNFSLCRSEEKTWGGSTAVDYREIHTCIHISTAVRTVLPEADFTPRTKGKGNRLIKAETTLKCKDQVFLLD